MKHRHSILAALLGSTLAFAACGHDDPDAEGCEHIANGPAQTITAAENTADAPEVGTDHKRYDVGLVDMSGGKGGVVKFASSEHGSYVIYLDVDVPVTVRDARNAQYPLSSTSSIESCSEVKARHEVHLDVGTYFFSFGPTDAEKVGLVLEQGAHDH